MFCFQNKSRRNELCPAVSEYTSRYARVLVYAGRNRALSLRRSLGGRISTLETVISHARDVMVPGVRRIGSVPLGCKLLKPVVAVSYHVRKVGLTVIPFSPEGYSALLSLSPGIGWRYMAWEILRSLQMPPGPPADHH